MVGVKAATTSWSPPGRAGPHGDGVDPCRLLSRSQVPTLVMGVVKERLVPFLFIHLAGTCPSPGPEHLGCLSPVFRSHVHRLSCVGKGTRDALSQPEQPDTGGRPGLGVSPCPLSGSRRKIPTEKSVFLFVCLFLSLAYLIFHFLF